MSIIKRNTIKAIWAVTHDLEMDKRPTLNYVLPELAIIRDSLREVDDDDTPITTLKSALRKHIDHLYNARVTIVHHVATSLTPPFRLLRMCNDSAEKVRDVKAYLRVMMREVSRLKMFIIYVSFSQMSSFIGSETDETRNGKSNGAGDQPPVPKRVNTRLAQFETRDDEISVEQAVNLDEKIENELTRYYTTSITNCDVMGELVWWVQRRDTMPLLAECAIRLIGTPASSAASERLWSTLGNM